MATKRPEWTLTTSTTTSPFSGPISEYTSSESDEPRFAVYGKEIAFASEIKALDERLANLEKLLGAVVEMMVDPDG